MGLEKNNPCLNPIETGVLGDHTSLGVGFHTSSGLFLCKARVYKFVT